MKLLLQIIAGMGLALLIAGGVTYFQSVNFVNHAKLTTGTVVGMFTSTDSDTNARSYCPEVSYTTKTGKIVKFESNVCQSPAQFIVGDIVNVYYDPQDPQNAQMKSYGAQYLLPTSLIVAGLPLALLGLFGLFLQWKQNRDRQVVVAV